MVTREEAIQAAGAALAEAILLRDSLPIEESARIAYTPTGPPVEQLIAEIRADRLARAS